MRRTLLLTAAAVLGLEASALGQPRYQFPRQGGSGDPVAVIDHWYRTYLGRSAVEDSTSRFWTDRLRAGISPLAIEAGILGSDEYARRNGGDLHSWVRAVYRDAFGRRATPQEIDFWSRRAYTDGLAVVAGEMLAQRPGGNNGYNDPSQQLQPGQNWGWGQQQTPDYDYRQPYYPYRR